MNAVADLSKALPHPIDEVRHEGLGWRDMPGSCEVMRKCNFFLFRRGFYRPHEDDLCRGVSRGRKNRAQKVFEMQQLLGAIASAGGNVLAACRATGISRHTHNYYMQHEPLYADRVRQVKGGRRK